MATLEIPDEIVTTAARVVRHGLLMHKFHLWGEEDDAFRLLDAWATEHGAPPAEPDAVTKAIDGFLGKSPWKPSLAEQLALAERRVASCSDALRAAWQLEVERLRAAIALASRPKP